MTVEKVSAKMQVKDEDGKAVLDADNSPVYKEATVDYNFGDDLNSAVDLCGAEVVFSNYVRNAKVALQAIIRSSLSAGLNPTQIQEKVNGWKPGMVLAAEKVDPETAIKNAWDTWSAEKKAEFIKSLTAQAE